MFAHDNWFNKINFELPLDMGYFLASSRTNNIVSIRAFKEEDLVTILIILDSRLPLEKDKTARKYQMTCDINDPRAPELVVLEFKEAFAKLGNPSVLDGYEEMIFNGISNLSNEDYKVEPKPKQGMKVKDRKRLSRSDRRKHS